MPVLVIRHQIKDFNTWKPLFDQHGPTRAAAGCKGGRLFRSTEDPNHIVIMFKWDSWEHARKFVESADLRAKMSQAGVIGDPVVYHLEEIGEFSQ